MKKFLFLSLIIIASCNKENKNISEADSFEETISKNLDRERKDSLLVSSNIVEISYNEKYEQPNCVKYTVRDIIKNEDRDGINFYTVETI